jgi:hypothetical protein
MCYVELRSLNQCPGNRGRFNQKYQPGAQVKVLYETIDLASSGQDPHVVNLERGDREIKAQYHKPRTHRIYVHGDTDTIGRALHYLPPQQVVV